MSRRRSPHRDAPYWVHSQPDDPTAPDEPVTASENGPCPGNCNRAYRAARIDAGGAHLDDDGDIVRPVPGQPIWCRPCANDIVDALNGLLGQAASVWSRTDGRLNSVSSDTDRTRQKTRDGSPSGSLGWDEVDAVIRWAVQLEDDLRAWLGHTDLTVPRPERLGRDLLTIDVNADGPVVRDPTARRYLGNAVRYLVAHATALLCWDDRAVQVGRDALGMARRLERASGTDELRHRLPMACLSCDRRALVRDDGSDMVECRKCHRQWRSDEYDRLAAEYGRGVRMGHISA